MSAETKHTPDMLPHRAAYCRLSGAGSIHAANVIAHGAALLVEHGDHNREGARLADIRRAVDRLSELLTEAEAAHRDAARPANAA